MLRSATNRAQGVVNNTLQLFEVASQRGPSLRRKLRQIAAQQQGALCRHSLHARPLLVEPVTEITL